MVLTQIVRYAWGVSWYQKVRKSCSVKLLQAIDAIGSQQFSNEIKRFYLQSAETGQHAKVWEGVDVDMVQNALLSEIQGLEIDTYGGIISGFKYLIYGNIAYDGMTDKPISLNRWALPRSSDSIANTIAHEAAHRIGLKHPHSNDNFGVAKCEPPYVIGSIVEKVIDPESWEPNNHCNLLEGQELILSAEVSTTN